MLEREYFPALDEYSGGDGKFFTIRRTKQAIGIGKEAEGLHPICKVPVRPSDKRWLNNLLLTVENFNPEDKSVTLSFEEFDFPCTPKLHLDQIDQQGDLIRIGQEGCLSCRYTNRHGRLWLYISLNRKIRLTGSLGDIINPSIQQIAA